MGERRPAADGTARSGSGVDASNGASRAGRTHGVGGQASGGPGSRSGLTAGELGLPDRVACPFCEHDETELHSPFGSALSVASYWCNRCRTAFEWIKWDKR